MPTYKASTPRSRSSALASIELAGGRMTCDPRQIFTSTRVLHLARQGGLVPPQGREWSRKQRYTRPARVDLKWLQVRLCTAWIRLQRDRLCTAWIRLQATQAAPEGKRGRGRPSNARARGFLSDLAAIYSSVGVKWTPAAVKIDKEAPFYKFAAGCFDLAGLQTGSLRRMIEERGRERGQWMRELPSEAHGGVLPHSERDC